jgi:hypothetical protein
MLLCNGGCVDPKFHTLDQSQLDMPGGFGLSRTQVPGESFTVAQAGLLAGIEVALGPCNGADTTGKVQLELFDVDGVSRGHVTLDESTLPNKCGGDQLVDGAIGAGYFDVTPLCLAVKPGDQFTFVLTLTGGASDTCDLTKYECVRSKMDCFEDQDCSDFYYVGFTNCGGTGCDSAPGKYPGGNLVMQNVNSGALSQSPSFELAFKTFVQ